MDAEEFEISMTTIFFQMNTLKEMNLPVEERFAEWQSMIKENLGKAELFDKESIIAHIMAYIQDAANENRVFPNDADKKVTQYWKGKILECIGRVKNIADTCKKLEKSIDLRLT